MKALARSLPLLTLLLVAGCDDGSPRAREEVSAGSAPAPEREEVRRFWAVYRKALAAKDEGLWEDAGRLFNEALQIEPEHQSSLYFLGTSHFELGRYAEAGQAWKRLVEAHPGDVGGHFQLGNLHACPEAVATWDLDAAEREFELALKLNREQTGPQARLAEIAVARGDLEKASRIFEEVIRTNPMDSGSFYLLGYIRHLEGDIEGAVGRLGQAARAIHGQSPVRGVLGEGDSTARLRTTFPRKRLFAALWLGLEKKGYAETPSAEQADAEYAGVRRYHESLARRLPGIRVSAPAGGRRGSQ